MFNSKKSTRSSKIFQPYEILPAANRIINFNLAEYEKLDLDSIEEDDTLENIKLIFNCENREVKMEKEIFAQLQIPDAVKDLPVYDGNPKTLYEFLENVEEILKLILAIDGTPQAKIILRAIRNKISGQANEVLNMYGTPLEWNAIRINLITHYADKRNETSLIKDLHICKQNTESVEQFYAKIIAIFSTMMNHIKVNENNAQVVQSKQLLFAEMCLNVFLSGLKEPLGSTIRSMRPNSLADALKYCLDEQNINYIKNGMSHSHRNSMSSPNSNNNNNLKNFNVPQNNSYPRNSYNNNHNFRFSPQRFQSNNHNQANYSPQLSNNNNNNANNKFGNNSKGYVPHAFYRFPNNNYNNNYRPNTNPNRSFVPQNNNKPEPMDTSSGNSRKLPVQNNNYYNKNRANAPRYTTEELFNMEDQNDQNLGNINDENFPLEASENKLDF